jgi:hypothetical protein
MVPLTENSQAGNIGDDNRYKNNPKAGNIGDDNRFKNYDQIHLAKKIAMETCYSSIDQHLAMGFCTVASPRLHHTSQEASSHYHGSLQSIARS